MEKNTTALFPGSEVVYADRECTIIAEPSVHTVAYTERGNSLVWDERLGNYVAVAIYMNAGLYAKVIAPAPSVAALQLAA